MKKYIYILASFISTAVLFGSPVMVHAATAAPPLTPLLITEVQVGSPESASQEFIELLNTTDTPIDFSEYPWQLQIASSTAKDWSSPLRTVNLTGVVRPHAYYVAASQYSSGGQSVQYLSDTAAVWFSAGMSTAAGHVRLVYNSLRPQADGLCAQQPTVVDEVEWSISRDDAPLTPSLDNRQPLLTAKATGITPGAGLERYLTSSTGVYTDTNNDTTDFALSPLTTPGAVNALAADTSGTPQSVSPLPKDLCSVTSPDTTGGTGTNTDPGTADGGDDGAGSASNSGLLAPQLSEVLPNPATPQTDEADEFIEIYNPNGVQFDLSGYTLTVGITTTHSYVLPAGTILAAGSFTTFYSADTGLSLSNSGGQVQLLSPDGTVISKTDAYGTAKEGQAWALISGVWQWTVSPTPNAVNVSTPIVSDAAAPAVKTAVTKTPVGKKAATPKVLAAKTKTKATAAKKKPKKAAAKAMKVSTFAANTETSKSPLHPAILATVVLLAVLYGAYEYRHDMANYVRRLRDNRAHRRKNRPEPARRRGD